MVLEEKISALEGAESTLIMASKMCASTVLLMALVPAGGHLVTTTDCYRKTRIFIETMLPNMGITVLLTPTHLAIVVEYAARGELYERICNAGRFSEDEVPKFEYVLLQVCDMFSLAMNEGGSILGVDNGEAEVLFAIDMKLEF